LAAAAEEEDTAGAVGMATEAATAMSMVVVANDAMAAAAVEAIPEAMDTAGATPDMVVIEGALAMATAADTVVVVVAATTATTTSRHTVFKARCPSIF
jgi:hypothetical protein